MNHETTSKDEFFAQLARISDEMIAAYDKDFAMGALVLAARFIAESGTRANTPAATGGNASPVPH
jgi:hypothetical protein